VAHRNSRYRLSLQWAHRDAKRSAAASNVPLVLPPRYQWCCYLHGRIYYNDPRLLGPKLVSHVNISIHIHQQHSATFISSRWLCQLRLFATSFSTTLLTFVDWTGADYNSATNNWIFSVLVLDVSAPIVSHLKHNSNLKHHGGRTPDPASVCLLSPGRPASALPAKHLVPQRSYCVAIVQLLRVW